MMNLKFSKDALKKVSKYIDSNAKLVLDLDDGVGPFSHELLENGLAYCLIILHESKVPDSFTYEIKSELGTIYVANDTEMYLENEMHIIYDTQWDRLKLITNSGVLENNFALKVVD